MNYNIKIKIPQQHFKRLLGLLSKNLRKKVSQKQHGDKEAHLKNEKCLNQNGNTYLPLLIVYIYTFKSSLDDSTELLLYCILYVKQNLLLYLS